MTTSAISSLRNGVFFTEADYIAAVKLATDELVTNVKARLENAQQMHVVETQVQIAQAWDLTYDTNLGYDLFRLFERHKDRVRDSRVHIAMGVKFPQTMTRYDGSVASASDPRAFKYWAKQGFAPVLT